jgi:predicted MFS family arabinose efflux permease
VFRLSRRGQVFASVCLFSYLVNFGRMAFAPLVDPFMEIFQVGPGAAGVVASAVWIGSAATRIPTGWLLTRIERHRAIIGMGVFLAGAAAFTALAESVALVAVGALGIGLASGVFYVSVNPLVSELYPERVGWAVGVRGTSSQLAAATAPALIAAVLAVSLRSWRTVFLALAGLAAVAVVVLSVTARRAEMPSAGAGDRDLIAGVRAEWRLVLTGILIIGTTGFVWQGLFNFYVPYLIETRGLTRASASTLLTVVFAAGVPAFFLSGRLADRLPQVPYILSVLASFVTVVAVLTVTEGFLALVAVSAVLGYVIHSAFPAMDTYLLSALPDENRSSAYAGYSGVMMLIQAPGSAVFGGLVDAGVGYTTVVRGAIAGLAVVGVGLALAHRAGLLPEGT